MSQQISDVLDVDEFTLGLVGPEQEWAGTVRDGGTVRTHTPAGCWGPMITPEFRGGHEVTRPIAVENAAPGDALVVRIKDVEVTSIATSTGSMAEREGAFGDDPFVDHQCPECGTPWPESVVEGTGEDAIRCAECGANASSFGFEYGYTVVFDDDRTVGITVGHEGAHDLAERAEEAMALPENSRQHPILLYEPDEMPGALGRLRPFIGNIGTTPAVELPDSHNAGDFGSFLIGAPHEYALTQEELDEHRTDGHMDIDAVREGTILLAPVKVPGAGVYIGDMHALQGDGEIAGHTMDVAGETTLQVEVVKGRTLEGPVLFPLAEDLPPAARPLTGAEREKAEQLARAQGLAGIEASAPISVVGTGADLNTATEVGLARAARLLGLSVAEIRNRATITGAIEIGRNPGVIQVTFLAPQDKLEAAGLLGFAREQYDL